MPRASEKTPLFLASHDPEGQVEGSAGLLVVRCPDAARVGKHFSLVERLCFGRETGGEVNLHLEDKLLSRMHASITREGESVVLIDHQSTNGTFVDAQKTQKERLHLGSVIRAGETLFVWALPPDSAIGPSSTPGPEYGIVGASAAMKSVRTVLHNVAQSTLPILILGETGSGKEVIARALHAASGRKGSLFVVNCAAVSESLAESIFFGHKKGSFTGAAGDSEGYWAAADSGTLFLDEIGDMPIALQPKILRAIESGEYTPVGTTAAAFSRARIVTATNAEIESRVAAGTFRRDLYARLQTVVLSLPPLRDRNEDILQLITHFWQEANPKRALTMEIAAAEALVLYDWPLNVRELRALVSRFALLPDKDLPIRLTHLPPAVRAAKAREEESGEKPSRQALSEALDRHGGSVARVAVQFAKHRRQIYRWLRDYKLPPYER